MGSLVIKNIRFRARHGYHDFERVVGNDFEVDLTIKTDISKAGESDDLADTVDYTTVCSIVEDVMHGEPVMLIETLLSRIGEQIMEEVPAVESLQVCIRKLHPPMETGCDYVEIRDTWQR